MSFDFGNVRYILNGEPWDASVYNRPIQDVVTEINNGLTALLNGGIYPWSAGTYLAGTYVTHNGYVWGALQNTSQTPSLASTHWSRVVTSQELAEFSSAPVKEIKTSNFTCVPNMIYFIDVTSSAVTATLPANPTIDTLPITFVHYKGDITNNSIFIGRNSKNIMGLAENMQINTPHASVTLAYSDAAQGWRIINI